MQPDPIPKGEEKYVPGPQVVSLGALMLIVCVFLIAIWSLKSTVQTEAANMVDACQLAASEINEGSADGR